jgi:hypothetical protein
VGLQLGIALQAAQQQATAGVSQQPARGHWQVSRRQPVTDEEDKPMPASGLCNGSRHFRFCCINSAKASEFAVEMRLLYI